MANAYVYKRKTAEARGNSGGSLVDPYQKE
jgi:hypothetical protein